VPIAIITGSDSGIGRATAVRLAADGFDVGVTWHEDERGAQETADEVRRHARRAEVCRLDLTELPGAADVVDDLADALGGIDVLVNNAGTSRQGRMLDLSYDDWRHTLAVDLDGAFLCAQRAARRMVEQGRGGRIVNITSVHEQTPLSDRGAYTVAKHGLGGLTKQLALELGCHDITVNSIAPGMVATPMTGLDDEGPVAASEAGVPRSRGRETHARSRAASRGSAHRTLVGRPAPPLSSTAASCSSIRPRGRSRFRVCGFTQYVAVWLEGLEGLVLSSTVEAYAGRLERHVLPQIGERRLDKVEVDDIVALISDLRKRGYSGTTIAAILTPLSRLFAHAARRGLVDFNPVSKLERSERPRVSRQERPVLNSDEIGRLLAAASPRFRTLLATAILSGLRQGELWVFTGERSTSRTN
jgi:hypothetical protein